MSLLLPSARQRLAIAHQASQSQWPAPQFAFPHAAGHAPRQTARVGDDNAQTSVLTPLAPAMLASQVMLGRPLLIAQLDAMHQGRGGDWYYRTFAPGRAMAELDGVYVVNLDQAHRQLSRVLEQADVLVVNGVCSADLLPVIQQRRHGRRLTVFEINDDVQEMQAVNPLAPFFALPEHIRLFRRLAANADAIQYSAVELQRLYGSLNARGRVFPNQLVTVPPLGPPGTGDQVHLGWGGSAGHLEDVAEVAPALCRFILDHPQVTLHLMCADRIWQLFDALPAERKRRTPVGSIEDYYAFVSRLDIGIAPNRDEAFNRARERSTFYIQNDVRQDLVSMASAVGQSRRSRATTPRRGQRIRPHSTKGNGFARAAGLDAGRIGVLAHEAWRAGVSDQRAEPAL